MNSRNQRSALGLSSNSVRQDVQSVSNWNEYNRSDPSLQKLKTSNDYRTARINYVGIGNIQTIQNIQNWNSSTIYKR